MNKPKNKKKEHEAYHLINQIIHRLRDPKSDLPEFLLKKKLNNCATGWCDYNKITIGIFYSIIPTICHEILHYIYEDWSETKILRSESLIKRYIKIEDAIKILRLFLDLV
jgi:hypothetical protein